jgi:hypothetical protein
MSWHGRTAFGDNKYLAMGRMVLSNEKLSYKNAFSLVFKNIALLI